jgi:hypothetical protein
MAASPVSWLQSHSQRIYAFVESKQLAALTARDPSLLLLLADILTSPSIQQCRTSLLLSSVVDVYCEDGWFKCGPGCMLFPLIFYGFTHHSEYAQDISRSPQLLSISFPIYHSQVLPQYGLVIALRTFVLVHSEYFLLTRFWMKKFNERSLCIVGAHNYCMWFLW